MTTPLSASAAAQARPVLDPAARMGPVVLAVRDLAAMERFYRTVLGLHPLARAADGVALGTPDGAPLVVLQARPAFAPAGRRAPGLFHTAFLLPGRADLGRFIRHMAEAGHRIGGASDHLVSEALYFDDPEGNGIEVYRDRDRADWPRSADGIAMATEPLDLQAVLATGDAAGGRWTGVPDGTTIGHVHLKVADLDPTLAFYRDRLGFDLMATYPGAWFVAAGGYHHHLGLNVWASRGGARAPETLGLLAATVLLPAGDAALRARLGAPSPTAPVEAVDPAGNRLVFLDGSLGADDALALAA